jgi:hypothetical protein
MKTKSSIPSEVLDPRGPLFPLVEHEVSGLDVLERDVLVTAAPPERRVNWLGVDRDGRLVLVVFAEAGDEGVPATVLGALAFGAEGRAATAKRWRSANIRVDLEPLVVVVAPKFTTRTITGLAFLASESVLVLELRSLESDDGAEPYLVRVRPGLGAAEARAANAFATFPAGVRTTLGRLARSVKRIDPEIEARETSGTLRWVWRGDELAQVTVVDGVLVAGERGGSAEAPLAEALQREAWLERFLVAHCARRAGNTKPKRPLDLLDRASGPLLSPEELAAFRE